MARIGEQVTAIRSAGRTGATLGRLLALFGAIASAACGDLATAPVTPSVVARGSTPLPYGGCALGADGKTYLCEPIDSQTPPVSGECDPTWWTPECGACMSSTVSGPELQGLSGCPDGGGTGPGGGTTDPGSGTGGGFVPPTEPPPPADTCHTDDPTLNDPVVQAGFTDLWTRSDPLAESQWERREQGAWIVQTAAGLEIVPWTEVTNEPCRIRPHYGSFSIPANAIAWVHTHPFWLDEVQYACEPEGTDENGSPRYARYNGFPNSQDIALAHAINESLGQVLPAYTIDGDKINRFTATSEVTTSEGSRYNRCGY
jgi:hypothetical protein